jgi:hypothetical protein
MPFGTEMPMFAWLHRKPTPASEDMRRVRDALVDYPPYEPPRWTSDTQSLRDANREYTNYFLDNRNRRVEALFNFLAKFDVALSLDDEGVKAVSAWCPIYADLLVDGLEHDYENDAVWHAYHWFEAPWIGPLTGLNPIFDLGVYMGECMLCRNSRLKWLPYINPEPNRGALHPIHGQRSGRPFDPMKWTYTECKNIHSAKMAREKWSESRFFWKHASTGQ